MTAKSEIDRLAKFIMTEVPGEPSQSEGAGSTAIRIIRTQQARIEALEIKAATWLALASPIWVGDESEGHFVCLACNQAGTDDGGCKTIQHLPDCEYAAALAAKSPTPKPTAPKPQILTTG